MGCGSVRIGRIGFGLGIDRFEMLKKFHVLASQAGSDSHASKRVDPKWTVFRIADITLGDFHIIWGRDTSRLQVDRCEFPHQTPLDLL